MAAGIPSALMLEALISEASRVLQTKQSRCLGAVESVNQAEN
jgi:hypothetical protein